MSKPKVFIFAPVDAESGSYRLLDNAGCELVYGHASWHTPQGDNEEEMCLMAKDAHVLTGSSIRSSPITRRIMESARDLRLIAKCTIGVDDVDLNAATDLGLLATHCPMESNWSGVAEGAMAIILALLKRIRERDEAMKRGEWRDPSLEGLYVGRRQDGYPGLTIGIIGLGRIGRRLVDLLAPWRVRILACDPYVEESRFVLSNVERVDFPTLMKTSDVVSLHVVLTEETEKLIDAEALAMMKRSAILVNTSRGQVVDEKALAAALQDGQLGAAGLDVFEDEPLAPDSPLINLGHKVLLSPHMVTSNVGGGLKPGIEKANRAILSALKGDVPENVFNPEVIPRWMERFGGRNIL